MSYKNKQVLIVEDNSSSLEIICRIINDIEGLTILKAENLEKAYKYAIENNIGLFIVDLILNTKMPEDVSGISFIENIRRVERYKFTPVIVITALEDPKMYAYANLHCYSYFEKPYDKNELKKAVLGALEFRTLKYEKEFYNYKKDGILYPIRIDEIIYITNNSLNTYIYQKNKKVLKMPYKSCKNMLLKLKSDKFVKCNKNTIINVDFILNIDPVNRYITLVNEYGVLEIGQRIKQKFLNKIEVY